MFSADLEAWSRLPEAYEAIDCDTLAEVAMRLLKKSRQVAVVSRRPSGAVAFPSPNGKTLHLLSS